MCETIAAERRVCNELKSAMSAAQIKMRVMTAAMLFMLSGIALAQSKQADIDYAANRVSFTQRVKASLPIDPAGINVVSGNLGSHEPDFSNAFMNHMNLWVTAKKPRACRIEWKLQAPADGMYEVDALAAGKGSRLTFAAVTDQKQDKAEQADSVDMLPAFVEEPEEQIRDHLVLAPNKGTHLSVRKGKWMYIPKQGSGGFGGKTPSSHTFAGPYG